MLRGINVGGRNSLPMKELILDLQSIGCTDVQTYIQSGNVVFTASPKQVNDVDEQLANQIQRRRGFHPQTLILSDVDFCYAVDQNPFPEAACEPKSLHMFFLRSVPADPRLDILSSLQQANERFQIIDKTCFLHAPDGLARSKLAAAVEKHLGVPATSRNWQTVQRLRELVSQK